MYSNWHFLDWESEWVFYYVILKFFNCLHKCCMYWFWSYMYLELPLCVHLRRQRVHLFIVILANFWREKEPTRRSLSFDGLCIANSICSCFPSVLMLFVYKTCRMSCAFFVFVVWQPSARIINSTILSFFLSHAHTSFAIFKMLFFFPNSPLVVSVWRAVVYIHICACMTRD